MAASTLRQIFLIGRMARQSAGRLLLALVMTFTASVASHAAVSVSIGVHVSTYPNLVLVPGYPVYYDPDLDSNYFFYDGEYWVYDGDNWYSSDWYDGPWVLVEPYYVPLFLLRVPVRYYHRPPIYFRGWAIDAPPRWGEHWGRSWEERRRGWDHWDRNAAPHAAPLPTYQRQFTGNRYPRAPEQQRDIRAQQYRYQPHEAITRQHFQERAAPERARVETQSRPNRETVQQRSAQEREDRARPQPSDARRPPPQTNVAQPAQNLDRREQRASNKEHREPQENRERQEGRESLAPARTQRPDPKQQDQQRHERNRGPQERPENPAPQDRGQPKQKDDREHDQHDERRDDNRR